MSVETFQPSCWMVIANPWDVVLMSKVRRASEKTKAGAELYASQRGTDKRKTHLDVDVSPSVSVSLYIFVFIYVHIHTYMHACMHAHIYIYIATLYFFTYIYIFIYLFVEILALSKFLGHTDSYSEHTAYADRLREGLPFWVMIGINTEQTSWNEISWDHSRCCCHVATTTTPSTPTRSLIFLVVFTFSWRWVPLLFLPPEVRFLKLTSAKPTALQGFKMWV